MTSSEGKSLAQEARSSQPHQNWKAVSWPYQNTTMPKPTNCYQAKSTSPIKPLAVLPCICRSITLVEMQQTELWDYLASAQCLQVSHDSKLPCLWWHWTTTPWAHKNMCCPQNNTHTYQWASSCCQAGTCDTDTWRWTNHPLGQLEMSLWRLWLSCTQRYIPSSCCGQKTSHGA